MPRVTLASPRPCSFLLLAHSLLLIHRMRGEDPPESAAIDYERTLRRIAAPVTGQWPVLDLILLGMGDDGHTASLFPDTPAVTDTIRWVVPGYAPQGTRSHHHPLGVINHASVVLFLITGRNKAVVVQRILEEAPTIPALSSRTGSA